MQLPVLTTIGSGFSDSIFVTGKVLQDTVLLYIFSLCKRSVTTLVLIFYTLVQDYKPSCRWDCLLKTLHFTQPPSSYSLSFSLYLKWLKKIFFLKKLFFHIWFPVSFCITTIATIKESLCLCPLVIGYMFIFLHIGSCKSTDILGEKKHPWGIY